MIEGKRLTLEWPYMPVAMFDQLQTLFEADGPFVWDPQDSESKTYNVHVIGLAGTYHMTLGDAMADGGAAYRRDVKLTLLILSEV
jgi:hypothetical protein